MSLSLSKKKKNESTSTSNLICAYNWTASLKTQIQHWIFIKMCFSLHQSKSEIMTFLKPFNKVALQNLSNVDLKKWIFETVLAL